LAARAVDEQVAHKLQLVVALLDSPVEGERHAALAAGSRLLAERGHRRGDLLTMLLDDIEQAVADRRAE
jgi:hypothetical protein